MQPLHPVRKRCCDGDDQGRDNGVAQAWDTDQAGNRITDCDAANRSCHRKDQARGGYALTRVFLRLLLAMLMAYEPGGEPAFPRQQRKHTQEDGAEQVVRRGCSGEEGCVSPQPGDFTKCSVIDRSADVGRGEKAGNARFA